MANIILFDFMQSGFSWSSVFIAFVVVIAILFLITSGVLIKIREDKNLKKLKKKLLKSKKIKDETYKITKN